MFDAVFSGGRAHNYRDYISGDEALSKRFNAMVRERDVFKSDNKSMFRLPMTRLISR